MRNASQRKIDIPSESSPHPPKTNEEHCAITPDQFDAFLVDRNAALQFLESCRP